MSDNIVVPYSELVSAGIVRLTYTSERYGYRRGFLSVQDIVFAETADGKRVDIHGINGERYTNKHKETIEKIFGRIERANPECKINRSIIGEHTPRIGRGRLLG